MKFFQFFVLLFLPIAVAAQNIGQSSIVGSWSQEYEIAKGESMTLEISEDMSATLIRDFDESSDQTFRSKVKLHEGIWTIDFDSKEEFGYKIVVAGWRRGQTTALFGTMYMYRNGELFNGVPVSFRKDS